MAIRRIEGFTVSCDICGNIYKNSVKKTDYLFKNWGDILKQVECNGWKINEEGIVCKSCIEEV